MYMYYIQCIHMYLNRRRWHIKTNSHISICFSRCMDFGITLIYLLSVITPNPQRTAWYNHFFIRMIFSINITELPTAQSLSRNSLFVLTSYPNQSTSWLHNTVVVNLPDEIKHVTQRTMHNNYCTYEHS